MFYEQLEVLENLQCIIYNHVKKLQINSKVLYIMRALHITHTLIKGTESFNQLALKHLV